MQLATATTAPSKQNGAGTRPPSRAKPGSCTGCALYDGDMIAYSGPKNPDIIVIGEFPKPYDISRGPFFSRGYGIVRTMFNKMVREMPTQQQPSRSYVYAARCCPPEGHGFKVLADTFKQCNHQLKMHLEQARPKVIVALGNEAVHSLGLKGTAKALRGGIYEYRFAQGAAVVIPTYAAYQLIKQPGLVPVVETDLQKAIRHTQPGIHPEEMDLRTPTDPDAIVRELEGALTYAERYAAETGKRLGVSVDTETTGFAAYDPEMRMIAISLSWDNAIGLAYPYAHRATGFSPEDLARIKAATEALLGSDAVSVLMHNAKFDHQWLVLKSGFAFPFATYDSMIGEHQLEEDKKGEYSLKALTKDYFPTMGKYEEELQAALAEVNRERQEAYKAERTAVQQERHRVILDYWLGLSQQERLHHCAAWIDKGYTLGNYQDLLQVKTRMLKGEQVVLKKYEQSVTRMLRQVKAEDLGLALPDPDAVPAPEPATFEDIDLQMLLTYAAIDALVTRKITGEQVVRFRKDRALIQQVSKRVGFALPTETLWSGMQTYSMPLCESLSRMEYFGARIDRDRLQDYIRTVEDKLAEYEDRLYSQVGYKFSTSSSAGDLRRILFEERRYPVKRRSEKTGEPSTDVDTLKELYDEFDDDFLSNLMVQRKLENCLSTFLKNWLTRSAADGKIHCRFNQTTTATNRLSSSEPNLQNVPFYLKEADLNLKALFIADDPALFDIYDMDISNAEMRVLTAYSRDEGLIRVFNEGLDVHCMTAEGISDFTYDDIYANKEDKSTEQYRQRQVAKKVIEIGLL